MDPRPVAPRPGELVDRTYAPGERPMAQLLENLGPWVRLQRTSTLAQVCRMLAVEVQRREVPAARLLFEVAEILWHLGAPERVQR